MDYVPLLIKLINIHICFCSLIIIGSRFHEVKHTDSAKTFSIPWEIWRENEFAFTRFTRLTFLSVQIFVALAVPLEDPLNSVSLSYFFEANYSLPPNITYFEPWLVRKRRRRNIDRTTIYRVFESKFERQVRKQMARFSQACEFLCTFRILSQRFTASSSYIRKENSNTK